MEIYFATTNKGKVQSLQRDLEGHGISVIQKPINLAEPRSSDVQEIAAAKISEAYSIIQKPTIVIDAGFYIHSLNGFPRAFVNFALETIGNEGILKLVDGKSRGCEFRECLAYMDNLLKEPKYFTRRICGFLSDKPRGLMQKHLWSRLGLIFIPENGNKTLAEMTLDEYKNWKEIPGEKNSHGEMLYSWFSANGRIRQIRA